MEPYSLKSLERLERSLLNNEALSLLDICSLLELYQIYPESAKPDIVCKVLLLSIMHLPKPDLKACIHLLTERIQNDDNVSRIIQLANYLETTRFSDFWAHASSCNHLLTSVPGFFAAVRENILILLGITFQRIQKDVLANYLNLDGPLLDALVKEKGFASVLVPSGQLIVLPKNENNQMVVKRTQEVIRMEQVAPVLRSVTVGFY
ncbi:hypothetical protein CEUSTIGMA_g7114.t1 [Chlamydomonas eustigma]|uniref:CSN8/PSMD8/EIF3K domain-containing protein n=1 Tax=Chlamydomonas eustigma TaxID=1157962 RepID=A0A250X9A9_9CHLO|nr:hypothetical protein CEUSTIGMA_g7114.t1 [Chlamydomonas eustigma]|eukprot:GAX79673.1 hypothetical protein CEUSTIGMA_g7114.t1 [Chlamydomonas eustigma]